MCCMRYESEYQFWLLYALLVEQSNFAISGIEGLKQKISGQPVGNSSEQMGGAVSEINIFEIRKVFSKKIGSG